MDKILKAVEQFLEDVKCRKIELYNEFSFQHELGIYLRQSLHNEYKVEFERNIEYFGLEKKRFTKKEIDIVIYNKNQYLCAIELKFPRNGQYPEQMYSFCKDIKFLEELKNEKFEHALFIALVEDDKFYSSNYQIEGIYKYFRAEKELKGTIYKPTGNNRSCIKLKGRYGIVWNELADKRYCMLSM